MRHLGNIAVAAVYMSEFAIIGGVVAAAVWVLIMAVIFRSLPAVWQMLPHYADFPAIFRPRGWLMIGALLGMLWAALDISNDEGWDI